jgi:predicted aspartyl protease
MTALTFGLVAALCQLCSSGRRGVRPAARRLRPLLCGLVVLPVLLGGGCVAARTAPARPAPRVILEAPTRVRIRVVQNITLVQATLNQVHSATLIVDTGAQSTIVSPSIVKRLGIVVPSDAPRREVAVVGGNTLEMPFVKLDILRVGDARIEEMEVGVFEVTPSARGIHGLLGADFLHRFRLMLDPGDGVMQLEPLR